MNENNQPQSQQTDIFKIISRRVKEHLKSHKSIVGTIPRQDVEQLLECARRMHEKLYKVQEQQQPNHSPTEQPGNAKHTLTLTVKELAEILVSFDDASYYNVTDAEEFAKGVIDSYCAPELEKEVQRLKELVKDNTDRLLRIIEVNESNRKLREALEEIRDKSEELCGVTAQEIHELAKSALQ